MLEHVLTHGVCHLRWQSCSVGGCCGGKNDVAVVIIAVIFILVVGY